MEETTLPKGGEIWESVGRTQDRHDYYFVYIHRDSGTETTFSPCNNTTGDIARCVESQSTDRFVSVYRKKTGVNPWKGRKFTKFPEFTTFSSKVSCEMWSALNDPKGFDAPAQDVYEGVAKDLSEHFEPMRAEYIVLKKKVDEMERDLGLYDKFKRVL